MTDQAATTASAPVRDSTPSGGAGRQAAIAFIFVTVMLDMVAIGVTAPILPTLITRMSGSVSQAGWINGLFMTAYAAMQFLCSPVQGSLSDRFGRRPVILVSVGGVGISYALMGVVNSIWGLGLTRVLGGICAANIPTAMAYIADVTPAEKRAGAYGMVGAAFGLGFIIGPAVGGLLGGIAPRLPFWVAAALCALNGVYGWFVLPESLPRARRTEFTWRRSNPVGSLRMLFTAPGLGALAMVNFLTQFGFSVLPTVLVLYAGQRFAWSVTTVGLSLALIGVCSAVIQGGVTGLAVRRLGERPTMVLALALGVIGFCIYGLAPVGVLFLCGVPVACLAGMAGPSAQALMSGMVSPAEQGRLQGANMSLQSLSGVIGPLLFGGAYALFVGPWRGFGQPGAPFLLAAAFLALGMALAILGARRARNVATSPGQAGFRPPVH